MTEQTPDEWLLEQFADNPRGHNGNQVGFFKIKNDHPKEHCEYVKDRNGRHVEICFDGAASAPPSRLTDLCHGMNKHPNPLFRKLMLEGLTVEERNVMMQE